ncbi:aminopeptidase [Elizabethkingia anophelis]|uniref:aminopeptidase n=1 Tax=Elizabethkingia anophelis TaxID=1117645 RepID=UPI002468F553|nr:aminopeptidase [Elizabethkingia anophelis]WGL71010.1 aminopeptidase [Elizabethkingia anophelis]
MKKILFFFVAIALFSCSRSSDGSVPEPDNPLYGKDKGGVYVKVSAERKLMSGEKVNEDLKASVVHIWDATNRDFDVQKSGTDIISGNLYDKKTGQSVKPIISATYKSSFFETLKAGRYFIYVNTGDVSGYYFPRFSNSSTYFDIKYKEDTRVTKIFREHSGSLDQPW